MRNSRIIGDLWPLCKTCKHIAQSHDTDGCSEPTPCPTCGKTDARVRCSCKEYVGPTLEEFMRDFMTEEERVYYRREWRLDDPPKTDSISESNPP